jgi:hypothetical protein
MDPHLGGRNQIPQTRRPCPSTPTRDSSRKERLAARGVDVEARGDDVAARGNRHDDDDCRLLSGTPLPSPLFSPNPRSCRRYRRRRRRGAIHAPGTLGATAAAKLALERRPELPP